MRGSAIKIEEILRKLNQSEESGECEPKKANRLVDRC